jgi:hypothetical protein
MNPLGFAFLSSKGLLEKYATPKGSRRKTKYLFVHCTHKVKKREKEKEKKNSQI